MNLINEYIKIVKQYTDVPDLFIRASAYHIISFLLGRYFKIDFKCEKANVWYVLSSIPARMRRSTIERFDSIVISTAMMNYYHKKFTGYAENTIYDMSKMQIIEDGTTEGICDSIIEANTKYDISQFSIHGSEFGKILKNINEKNTDVLFSKLYYGESYKQVLSQRVKKKDNTRFIKDGMYVTMFSTMQEPDNYLNKSISRQGLLRRIKIIYIDPSDLNMEDWKSPFESGYYKYRNDLIDFSINKIVPLMFEIEKNNISLDFDTELRDKIKTEAYIIDKYVKEEPSDYNIYQQSNWEHIIKAAICETLGDTKNYYKDNNKIELVLSTMNEYNTAHNFIKGCDKHIENIFDLLNIEKVKPKYELDIDRVLKYIRKSEYEGIIRSKLLQLTHLSSKRLTEILFTLIERKDIIQTEGDNYSSIYIAQEYSI